MSVLFEVVREAVLLIARQRNTGEQYQDQFCLSSELSREGIFRRAGIMTRARDQVRNARGCAVPVSASRVTVSPVDSKMDQEEL